MLKNNCTEEYIKGFVPGLEYLLWTDETNYDKQKARANEIVYNDLNSKGLRAFELMPQFTLRESGVTLTNEDETSDVVEDTISRRRIVIEVVNITVDDQAIILQGSNDSSVWYDITNVNLLISDLGGVVTEIFLDTYKYYRINVDATGLLDYRAYLTETTYDLLFAYKWLELILRDAKTSSDDQFALKEIDFRNDYNGLLQSNTFNIDTDGDGEPDETENFQSITMLK
jgi:hypothetical protein